MTKGKKLKTGIYGLQILIVFIMTVVIFCVFNIIVDRYMTDIAEKNIENRFSVLDAYYNSEPFSGFYADGSDFIITVRHMITDDAYRLLHPAAPWSTDEELSLARRLLARYLEGGVLPEEGRGSKLALEGKTYYLMPRTYVGTYDNGFVQKSPLGRPHHAVAYIDITPLAVFLKLLNKVLLLLTSAIFIVTAGLLLSSGKKLDRSFQTLKEYILEAGKRKRLTPARPLPYSEFNEITDTVYQLSSMLEASEAAQTQFFQNASHELRTPLTTIRGYAEGIASGVIPNAKASAAVILEHSDRMTTLVDELLYISKLDSRKDMAEDSRFDLRETLARCVWAVTGKAELAGIAVDLHIPNEPAVISGNEEMLERAFSNILSNAVRYAKSKLDISFSRLPDRAEIFVTDDGPGISEKDLPHIFERFYKGSGGVTGIGLSITHEAVSRHGGTVTAACEGGLTTFRVVLPTAETP